MGFAGETPDQKLWERVRVSSLFLQMIIDAFESTPDPVIIHNKVL